MAEIIFYEKTGCAGNARQKALLVASGHQLVVRDLRGQFWSNVRLLEFLADLPVSGSTGGFARLRGGGHVPLPHFAPVAGDPAAQALRFAGAPYLWGGRSICGIDCSGLVQLAHLACGVALPRDSDMQAALAGRPLAPEEPLARGDLVFWRGHVALMLDGATLVHATAHRMAVVAEPLVAVEARVLDAGGGPILARRRP